MTMISAEEVAGHLTAVRGNIDQACQKGGRDIEEVTLVAVSKTWPVEHVQKAYEAGQRVFGENKLQEVEQKVPAMATDCEWHFIGHVQRNKVRKILTHCSTIHAVDSLKLAQAISRIAGEEGKIARIFLQLNVRDEDSKFGFSEDVLRAELADIKALEHIDLRGLMAIPPAVERAEDSRENFRYLRELRDQLRNEYDLGLPELSMGMSGDYEIAIEEGASVVRVGSSIFGARNYSL